MRAISNKQNEYTSDMLKELLRTKISNQINTAQSPKCLYINKNILTIINYVFDLQFANKGIRGNIYTLQYDSEIIDVDKANNVVFFVYPQPKIVQAIASMVLKNQSSFIKKTYHIYFVPNKNYLCVQKLQALNIMDKVIVKNFNFDFIPLNRDLFSLQLPKCLDVLDIRQSVVKSLLKLSNINGKFANIRGLGPQSKNILLRLQKEYDNIPEIKQRQNSHLIMMDRSLDYVSPMLTPFTYEGILDVLFGINMHLIQLPGHLIQSQKPVDTFMLNNQFDRSYAKISQMNIREVPQYLSLKSKELHQQISKKKQEAKSLKQFNDINQQLMKEYLLLQFHKNIITFVMEKLNDCQFIDTVTSQTQLLQGYSDISKIQYLSIFYPIEQVLKLQVIASQTAQTGSYYQKYQQTLINFVLNAYSLQHLITLNNLKEKGILRSSKMAPKWREIVEAFDLIPDTPHGYTYVFLIYSCLLVRYLQLLLVGRLSPDMTALLTQQTFEKGRIRVREGQTVYVYFIGGITVGQIQCLRLLSKKLKLQIMICTTQQTSGAQLIRNCFQDYQQHL